MIAFVHPAAEHRVQIPLTTLTQPKTTLKNPALRPLGTAEINLLAMAKSETITTRAPNAGKKTPAKASHSTTAKAKPAGTARKATSSKKDSSKKKPRSKTEAEEPYPAWAAPTPAAAVEAVARLATVHGLPSPPERKSILDSLVRTILSQNTSATSVCH